MQTRRVASKRRSAASERLAQADEWGKERPAEQCSHPPPHKVEQNYCVVVFIFEVALFHLLGDILAQD